MEDSSWIKLYRKILKSPIWENEKALKIWIWCLVKATHKERIQLVGQQEVNLEKGQFVFGRKKASEELSMTESTIYKYIKLLEKLQMISVKSNNKFSIVSVEKWEDYQIEDIEKEQQSNNNVFLESNNKLKARTVENSELQKNENENSNNKQGNNKVTGSNVTATTKIANTKTATITTKEQQSNTNKNVKNLYLFLFNKYKEKIQEEPRRTVQIISELKNSADYELLSEEEQENIFYELMSPNFEIRE